MNIYLKAAALVVCTASLSACANTGIIYADPRYHRASYETVRQLATPMLLRVSVYSQGDGVPLPTMDGELRMYVERTLRASRVFTPTKNSNVPVELTVVANKITDPVATQAKGFGIGSTDAAAGPTIDEYYEFNFTYICINNQQPVQAAYLHAIHVPTASGVDAATLGKSFGRVVEDVVLNFIKDLEDKKQL